MHLQKFLAIFVILLFLGIGVQAEITVNPIKSVNSGVIFTDDDLFTNQSGDIITADISSVLNESGSEPISAPASVMIFQVRPGIIYSPNTIRPAPEVLYILGGSGIVSTDFTNLTATTGDGVFVPSGSIMQVENTGNESLWFISVLSSPGHQTNTSSQNLYKIPSGTISPIVFGNESDSTRFSMERVFNTYGNSLPLSFDLSIARLPAGNLIPDHYLESGQVGYVLEGAGNLTINCVSHPLTSKTVFYIPASGVQNYTADTDLSVLMLTEPFYQAEQDHMVTGVC